MKLPDYIPHILISNRTSRYLQNHGMITNIEDAITILKSIFLDFSQFKPKYHDGFFTLELPIYLRSNNHPDSFVIHKIELGFKVFDMEKFKQWNSYKMTDKLYLKEIKNNSWIFANLVGIAIHDSSLFKIEPWAKSNSIQIFESFTKMKNYFKN